MKTRSKLQKLVFEGRREQKLAFFFSDKQRLLNVWLKLLFQSMEVGVSVLLLRTASRVHWLWCPLCATIKSWVLPSLATSKAAHGQPLLTHSPLHRWLGSRVREPRISSLAIRGRNCRNQQISHFLTKLSLCFKSSWQRLCSQNLRAGGWGGPSPDSWRQRWRLRLLPTRGRRQRVPLKNENRRNKRWSKNKPRQLHWHFQLLLYFQTKQHKESFFPSSFFEIIF